MKEAALKSAEEESDLTDEARNLLSVAFKNVVGTRRSSWRVISSVEKQQNLDDAAAERIREYKGVIESELNGICSEVIVSLSLLSEIKLKSFVTFI